MAWIQHRLDSYWVNRNLNSATLRNLTIQVSVCQEGYCFPSTDRSEIHLVLDNQFTDTDAVD